MARPDPGAAQRLRHAAWRREQSAEVADIGDIPPVADPARRARCERSLLSFLREYFPASTGLRPFGADHERAIARLQACILDGGRFVEAMFRGSAKTTIAENAAIWSVLFGHRRFVPIFGADAGAAEGNISSIKMELAENDLLYADFPDACHAVRALEGKPQRCKSQHHHGRPTHIEWTADTIVMPHVVIDGKQSPASGAIITATGITGASRGMKHKRPDGTQARPDFILIDDPQTDESAASPAQVAKRLSVIRKSILKLGGHGRDVAVFMAATVIAKDDLVDQLLDHKRNPSWQAERIPFVKTWSKAHDTLWLTNYAQLRNSYNSDIVGDQDRAHRAATAFYETNRAAMDEGAAVSWDHAFDPIRERSAIQHAYNALIDDGEDVFASEYQNSPLVQHADDAAGLAYRAVDLSARVNGLARGVAPMWASKLTAFVDVQERVLFYAVCAWRDDFTGAVIDYGSWPKQSARRYTAKDATNTLAKATGTGTVEGGIAAGLEQLAAEIVGREWRREDGVALRVDRCLIDAGYQTATVYEFARRSKYAATILPSKGVGLGPTNRGIDDYQRKKGERLGRDWLVTVAGNRVNRYVLIDTNAWKTHLHHRLAAKPTDAGSLTFYGKNAHEHEMIAEHLWAETGTRTEGRGRVVYVWKLRPGQSENHLADCLVGCAVAASMCGCATGAVSQPKTKPVPTPARERVRYL